MKIKIDIDCTPEEMRDFLGLPDIKGLQAELLSGLQAQMTEAMTSGDPDALNQAWGALGMKNMESMQQTFWAAMTGTAGREDK
jgi:hypothetical protein